MPDLGQEITVWLHSQPDWLQQAAVVQLSSGEVSTADIQAFTAALKTPQGQAVTASRSFPGLTASAIPQNELRLLNIGAITGIENLGPRIPLAFGTGNLCVIYGHNGSGKSSYSRLLKRICGKPRAKELKPNVFQPRPETRMCTICYQVAGTDHQVEWQANGLPIDALQVVDIFDAEAAVAYLTEETSVTYTPPAVALLEALAGICDQVKAALQAEEDRLISSLPVLPSEFSNTEAGKAYLNLKHNIEPSTVQLLTEWHTEHGTALEQLAERLKTQDPEALARAKRSTKGQVTRLADYLKALASALGETGLSTLRSLGKDAYDKRQIAAESAKVTSASLEGIGSDTWRALWEAARAYSQIAYPDRFFPVTEDALCVLCHQSLDVTAQQRLKDFEGFVKGKLESEAATAEKIYKQTLAQIPPELSLEELNTRCQAAGLIEAGWQDRILAFIRLTNEARKAAQDCLTNDPVTIVDPPTELLAELDARAETLEREAVQHELDSAGFDRDAANLSKLQLEARRWTTQQANSIKAELERLSEIAEYEKWKRMANSKGISTKASDISQKAITEAFIERFNAELKALSATRIQVELVKTRTTKGKVLHRIHLKGIKTGEVLPDTVLSDGERRIISLAAFISDVVDKPYSAPFIFDDPISSLDHDYEWQVATRLAELAQSRQVLIFTHRLSLFGAMEDAAKKFGDEWKKKNLYKHCIETFDGVAGHPADQEVWNATTTKANNILITRLDDAKKAGVSSGATTYRALAQGICSDFRKLIERTIEDDFLNEIVRRHRRSIQTDNRLAQLTHITSYDCAFFDVLMTKYSCYEHSQSSETPAFIPEEPELRSDLNALKSWREDFKKRPKGEAAHA